MLLEFIRFLIVWYNLFGKVEIKIMWYRILYVKIDSD